MKKNKFIIFSGNEKEDSPASERIKSFKNFFYTEVKNSKVSQINNFIELLNELLEFRNFNIYIFISMPQFRRWYVFLIPFVKVILDIRDGWSIAMYSGYGGTVTPNKIKGRIAKTIEKFGVKRSQCTITCTPGLANYLSKMSSREIICVPNGLSREKHQFIRSLNSQPKTNRESGEKIFICAGKFSEYGQDNVIRVLRTISERYKNYSCRLRVIGADIESNKWIFNYLKSRNITIRFSLEERMPPKAIYKELKNCDVGVVIIRDPTYELGTKVYEYISSSTPVLNYFDEPNNFTNYFEGVLDYEFGKKSNFSKLIIREDILEEKKQKIIDRL